MDIQTMLALWWRNSPLDWAEFCVSLALVLGVAAREELEAMWT